MCDQSEIDELYDEFLDLDGNPYPDLNLNSKNIDHELDITGCSLDGKWDLSDFGDKISNLHNNNIKESDRFDYNANGDINSINNNHIKAGKVLSKIEVDAELNLLNQNSLDHVGVYFDENGKMQNRNEFSSLKYSNTRPSRPTSLFTKVKECEVDTELKEVDEQHASPYEPTNDGNFHCSDWGPESLGLWHSGPSSLSLGQTTSKCNAQQDSCADIAFTTSLGSGSQSPGPLSCSTRRAYSQQQLGAKVEMVYSLLSMLGTSNRNDMSKTLLAMSSSSESCLAMRQSGCLPLLIQLIHSPELDIEVRSRAAEALQNIVLAQPDEKKKRREVRVLKLLQQIREYCDELKILATDPDSAVQDEPEKHPVSAMEALMKFSFDAEHRQAMCSLGGLHAIAELIQLDHEVHGSLNDNPLCITLRRYAGMALTNLIFGDGNNKALLCSFSKFMRALVSQLMSPSEDLRQVTASVLRNLSWRADSESKQALRDIGAVTALMVAAMEGKKESTLKSILSALWNLSGHCSMNKVDVCAVPGAVAFLVKMLKYKAASNTLAVVENAGGILRNISSHIAIREDYRQILRDNNCFEILLEQLKSSSLTIVSNACGTLWNLSARCTEDQRKLWEMGAISMLRSLIQSKHKMISMGSSAALKNLLAANPGGNMFNHMDSTAKSLGLQTLPTLFVRKQRALEQELDINLSETCDNIEPSGSPIHSEKNLPKAEERKGNISKRSDSHESVTSTQSDSAYEKVNQLIVKNENKILENKNVTLHGSLSENQGARRADEQKLMKRYKCSMIPTPAFKKINQEKANEKTKVDNMRSDIVEKPREENVQPKNSAEHKEKRGIPVLKNRIKPKNEGDLNGIEGNYSPCYPRNNFHSKEEEDFPVNYSLKYSETEVYSRKMSNENIQNPKENLKEKENFERYRDYAETDLDQPTDFSLKYGEETSSDEELKNQSFNYFDGDKTKESGYYSGQPESEDTTRTYYTEGTPYEGTPYNYSMSDLRIDHAEARDNIETTFHGEKGDTRKLTLEESSIVSSTNEKECQNLYVNNTGDYRSRVKNLPRDFESGVSTPERPIQYCEEGTPGGCFSRVSSLSSLSGGKEPSNKHTPEKADKKSENKDLKKSLKHLENEDPLQSKAVTFGVTRQYECPDETPLMFSRSSSINSLSSFEEIHQSIPDDRSSVMSDFSRMTSGIISPSELPDSPTQTIPPSPKQCKAPVYFTSKLDTQKKSVFEDAVATYKQEDTPIEFSRATSLSSLNIENTAKQDFNLKTNSSASSVAGMDESKVKEEKNSDSLEQNQSNELEEQTVPDKNELEREKLELESVTEVDENILVDCINIGIQENSRRPRTNRTSTNSQEGGRQFKHLNTVQVKVNGRAKYQSEARKIYSTYEESDDAVHTYYTEGTPANVSHAGSNSDLSSLSMITDALLPPPAMEDNSDDGSFCSGDTENILAECIQSGMPKAKHQKEKTKNTNIGGSVGLARIERPNLSKSEVRAARVGMINSDAYSEHEDCGDYGRRKDHHLTAKDEISTFATENSPCNFSIRSSLSDLTVNSVDSPVCLSRPEDNREKLPQAAANSSSSSIVVIESEKEDKTSEENRPTFNIAKKLEKKSNFWEERNIAQSKVNGDSSFPSSLENEFSENIVTIFSRHESLSSLSVESFDSSEPTPLEQALLEQCIHSGMPHKTLPRDMKNYKTYDDSRILRLSNMDVDEADSTKNAHISSATVEESTVADEKNSARIVVGQENAKGGGSNSVTSKCQHSSDKNESDVKNGNDTIDGNQGENLTSSYSGHTWSDDYTSPNENSITCNSISGKIEGLRVLDESPPNDSSKDEMLLPTFKIGSEVRDPKLLQAEATKICREIRKYQDFDMSSSITSEVSQVSCSSFLDSGEFSFIDLSKDPGDLDSSESFSLNKGPRKLNSLLMRTSATAVLEEPMSLPSIGSVKSDLLEDIDLESSILSVASLTSEVAENLSRDKENTTDLNGDKTPENALDSPVTVFDRGDDTLNADTIGSDTEIFEDENSIISQENLPHDEDDTPESTPKRSSKKLTPKEKRQILQDRFRTYTIHDFKSEPVSQTNGIVDKQQKKKITPKERRLNERERFLTRVLGKDNLGRKSEEENEEVLQNVNAGKVAEIDSSTLILKKRVSLESGGLNSRTSEKEYLYRRTASEEANSVNNLLPANAAERKEILANAKLVAISLKTAAEGFDSEAGFVSDSDAEGSNRTFAIDTATYNKHEPLEMYYKMSDDECSNEDGKDSEDEPEEKKGPRILKPDEKIEEPNEASAKAIRGGRKKQVYSSPVKRFLQTSASSMPASPKITLTNKMLSSATTKSLPNVPKSIQKSECPTMCREGTFTKEEGTTVKQTGLKYPRSIPVLNKKQDNKSSNANTGVRYKSAPLSRNSRAGTETLKTGRPVSSYIPKSSDKLNLPGSNMNKPGSGSGAFTGSKQSGIASNTRKPSSPGPNTLMKNSPSNQSLKSINSAKSNSNIRARNAVLRSPRSQSNGSLDSEPNADKTVNNGKSKNPKKEVTSKIASLWKKVEDTKKKGKNVKDNRVWITSDKELKGGGNELVIEKEEILELSSGKVVRSSTFQGLGEDGTSSATTDDVRKKKHRNSGDFYSSKCPTERGGNFEGRHVISAIVPPYNYNPPASVQVTPPVIKQVDSFHKGSVKVTTV